MTRINQPDMQSRKDGACPVCGRDHDEDCHWYSDLKTVLCYTKGAGGTSSVSCPADSVPANGGNYVFKSLTKDRRAGIYALKVEQFKKANRPASKTDYFYQDATGQNVVKVTRTDFGDDTKKFSQLYFDPESGVWERWIEDGKTSSGKKKWKSSFTDERKETLKSQVPLYNLPTVMAAIAAGKDIWLVEGEGCADALGAIGIVATTLIGGAERLTAYNPNALEVLHGARVIPCPDRDQKGLAHMEEAAEALKGKATVLWCYCKPEHSAFWIHLQKDGGLDCKDWLDELGDLEPEAKQSVLYGAVGAAKEWGKTGEGMQGLNLPEPKTSDKSIAATIRELLGQDLSEVELQEEKIKLRMSSGMGDREFNSLWNTLEEERNLKETQGDRHRELEKLLSIKGYSLPLKGILHPSLAEPFEKVAGWIGSSPEAFLTTLLPTIGTLAWAGTELVLMPATGFRVLPILYTGLVAESGSSKSPTQKMVTKPLFQLQNEEEEDYKKRLESWNDQCKKADENGEPKPDKPNIREFYTVDVTREAVAMIQSQQPDRGFLCNHDELSGLFSGQNAYRGGKGGDKEALLSARDGSGLKVNRASGKRISTSGSYHSITGGTQPDTLKKMMGDFDDGSGQWARFMWCLIFQKPARYISLEESGSTIDEMQSRLYSVYSLVQTYSPKTYTLSPEAENLYAAWFNQLDDLRLKEERQAFRAIYSKAKGNTGEMVLILHLTNSAAARLRTPDDMVSAQTMKAAIALMKFYIGQVKLVHSLGDEQRGEVTPVLAKIIEFSKRRGDVSARECKSGIATLRNEDAAKIRGYFRDLVEGDYGVLTGSGDRVRFQATVDKSKTVDKKSSTPSTVDPVSDKAITADTTVGKLSTPSTPDTEPLLEEISETVDDFPLSNKSGGFNKGDRVPSIGVGDKITITEGEYQDTYPTVTEVIEDSGQIFYRVAERYGQNGQPDPSDFEAVIHLSHCKKYSVWDRRSPFASPKPNTYAPGSEVTILDTASPYKGRIGEVRGLTTTSSGETLYRVVRDYEGTPELNFDATFPLQSIRALAVKDYTWEPA